MSKESRLVLVKLIHTLIWIFFNIVIFYLLYAVLTNNIDRWVWIGYGLIALEGLVLLLFKFTCPLTLIARRYSNSARDNFDIYLPNWLAKNTKLIYTSLMTIIIIITAFQLSR